MAIACAWLPCCSPALGWLMLSGSLCCWQPGWVLEANSFLLR